MMSTSFYKKYKFVSQIGEGSFSEVLKCQERETGNYYAAKRLKKEYNSLAEVTESPEIVAMRKLSRHPNILHIIEFHVDSIPGKVTFIFELMEMSLFDMMKSRKRPIPEVRVKRYLHQLLKGLNHLHHHGIFHRDIKPENILIKNEVIKLADLGSIKGAYSRPPYTEYISTRWYRSPECLLTAGYYGPKMDVWACGCVFYELLTTKPLFPGADEIDQIAKIHDVLGTPHTRLLAKFHRRKSKNCEFYFQSRTGTGLACLAPNLSDYGRDIMKQMLTYDPEHRTNVRRLLEHRYFNDLRESESLQIKKSVAVSRSSIKERRNSLLSYITSDEKKKKNKLLRKKSPPKTKKQTTSSSTRSLSNATGNYFIPPSTASKTLPILITPNSKRTEQSAKKIEKRAFNSEEQLISTRSWGADSFETKISSEKKKESKPVKRKAWPKIPKARIHPQQAPIATSCLPTYQPHSKWSYNFESFPLPNIESRKSDVDAPRRFHEINAISSLHKNYRRIHKLSTIPERSKEPRENRYESPSDTSSTEGVKKKLREE